MMSLRGRGRGAGRAAEPDTQARLPAAYWKLWTSSALSNAADGIVKVGLPLVAVQVTRSPGLIAGLSVALTLPWLLLSLPAGALADRWDRRWSMAGANAVRAALLGGLVVAIAVDAGSIWVLYAVALLLGSTETLYDTSAQSLVPQLVHANQLSRANGRLYAAELTTNQFIGPPLGGVLVGLGAGVAFCAPAALWACAVLAILLLRGSFRIERSGSTTLRADIAEGVRFLWRQPLLRRLAASVGVFNFASNATFTVFVLFAVGPGSALELSGAAYGLLLATIAAGSLAGSFLAAPLERRFGRSRGLKVSLLAGALLMVAPAALSDPVAIGATFVIGGIGIVVFNVITVSLRQTITPSGLLGRVNSGFRLVGWGTMPFGAAAGGLLAEAVGLRAVFATMGVLVVLLVPLLWGITDEHMDATIDIAGGRPAA